MEKYIDQLKELTLFQGISIPDLEHFIQCLGCYQKHYSKGEYLSFEQENVKNVGIVLKGVVHMIQEDIWGGRSILTRITPGQLFGETFACGNDTMASASFCAAEHTKVLLLPFRHVLHTCSRSCGFHHQIIENMVTLLAGKNKSLMEKLQVVSQKSLREKILAYLSLEAQKQESTYFEVPLGRMDLANYLCADRSALTRELANMKSEGILDYDRNTFHLL